MNHLVSISVSCSTTGLRNDLRIVQFTVQCELLKVDVAACGLSTFPPRASSSATCGSSGGWFCSSATTRHGFFLGHRCRVSRWCAGVRSQAEAGPNVSAWRWSLSSGWCFSFLAPGQCSRLVVRLRILLSYEEGMLRRGLRRVKGLLLLFRFLVFIVQDVPAGSWSSTFSSTASQNVPVWRGSPVEVLWETFPIYWTLVPLRAQFHCGLVFGMQCMRP